MAAFTKIAVDCLEDPLIWLFLASVAFVLLHRQRLGKAPFPPGPKPLPFIGNLAMADQLTHRGLAALARQHGGLLHLRLGRLHVFAVSTPEYAREVLQAQDGAFSNRPATMAVTYLTYGRSDMAFAHNGAYWRQMRKLCVTKLFSRRRAETWLAVREGYGGLARAVAIAAAGTTTTTSAAGNGKAAVNLGELIFNLTVSVIFRAAFSARDEEGSLGEFIAILRAFSQQFEASHVGDFFPWLSWVHRRGFDSHLRTARGALDRFIDKIIHDHMSRRKNPADADADLVDGLLAFLAEGNPVHDTVRLTRDNIKAMIMDMLFGGPETVASTTEWAMAEMMRNPDSLVRLQRELADAVGLGRTVRESDLEGLPFLRCVVKETLRMHPPIPLLLHEAAKDCVVLGYSVPKGSRVVVNAWAINRDRGAWEDPEAFRPARFMPGGEGEAAGLDLKGGCFEFLPFGSGRRSCPAQGLAQHAVELAVAQLAHGFGWELPGGMKPDELDMADVSGLTAPRASRLWAVPTPRLTCPL